MSQQGPPVQGSPVYLTSDQWVELSRSVTVIRQSVYFVACVVGLAALAGLIAGFIVLVDS